MTPQHRDLLDKRFTQLSKSGTNVDTLGWVALHAEALVKIEEHPECIEVLERVSNALRSREKELRKNAIRGSSGPGPRLGRHRPGR
jgi:hypothetical protein